MTEVYARFNDNGYYATTNDEFEAQLKFNTKTKKVRPNVVPEGYKFTPYPLFDEESEIIKFLDPRYIMKHRFSATCVLAFFLLEPVTPSKTALQSFKTEAQKEERHAKREVPFTELENTDENGDVIPFDPPAPHNTEEEAINNVNREMIYDKLCGLDAMNRKWNTAHPKAKQRITKHAIIYKMCYIWKYTLTEASIDLDMPKTTVSEAVKHINKIARPFYES